MIDFAFDDWIDNIFKFFYIFFCPVNIPKNKSITNGFEIYTNCRAIYGNIIQFKCFFIFLEIVFGLIVEADFIYLREIKIYLQ